MVKTKKHSYTLRTDYDSYNAGLEDFKALTTNWQALLHALVVISNNIYYYNEKGEKSTLTSLLRDNVLTVLADIHRKKLDGYSMSFTSSRGTIRQGQYVRKLKNDITNWENRLKAFLRNSVSSNYNECSSVVVARELCDILSESRKQSEKDEYQYYYGMLHTVCDIQKRIGEYTQKIENCGDTEPSVSLLMSFVRNYCSVAQKFNKSFAKLPDLYRNNLLHRLGSVHQRVLVLTHNHGLGNRRRLHLEGLQLERRIHRTVVGSNGKLMGMLDGTQPVAEHRVLLESTALGFLDVLFQIARGLVHLQIMRGLIETAIHTLVELLFLHLDHLLDIGELKVEQRQE